MTTLQKEHNYQENHYLLSKSVSMQPARDKVGDAPNVVLIALLFLQWM
jgi:hypothetical protein